MKQNSEKNFLKTDHPVETEVTDMHKWE